MEKLAATPIRRDVLLATGSDSREYLNSQLTQDVSNLRDGASAWSFLLEPKGEIVALIRVTQLDEHRFALDTEPGFGSVVREGIDGFLFRTDVSFEETEWSGFAIRGPGAESLAIDAPIVMHSPWPGIEGTDVLGPAVELPHGVDHMSEVELDAVRIRLGWPAMVDFDDKTTPAMTGIVPHTISFVKGCYPGQEMVARVHYRQASPPRRLVQVGFHPCAEPASGDRIVVDGVDAGWLTSVSRHQPLALGYLLRAVESPNEGSLGETPICVGDLPVESIPVDAAPPKPTTAPLTLRS